MTAALRRRNDLGPFDTSVLHFRVLPNDLDPNWHVNNGRYLTLMDLGRIDLIIRMGYLRVLIRHRWMPVLGGAVIRFQRPLAPWQRYELRTRLVGWDDRWLYLKQEFVAGGKAFASAYVRGLFRGREGSIPTPAFFGAADFDLTPPPLPDAVRQWQALDQSLS